MEVSKILRIVLLSVIFVLSLSGFSVIFFVFLRIGRRGFDRDVKLSGGYTSNINTYRYYHFNPETEESSFGFVDMKEPLPKEGYISSSDSNNRLKLISSFETTEYRCYGTCSCDQTRREAGAIPLVRNIIYLVAAMSTYIAVNHAREYFHKQCEEEMKDVCDTTFIQAETDYCTTVRGRTISSEHPVNEEDLDTGNDNWERLGRRRFLCKGRCLDATVPDCPRHDRLMVERKRVLEKRAAEFQCNELKLTKEYDMSIATLEYNVQQYDDFENEATLLKKAELYFLLYDFNAYCEYNSRVDIFYFEEKTHLNLCVGYDMDKNTDVLFNNFENHLVHCVLLKDNNKVNDGCDRGCDID